MLRLNTENITVSTVFQLDFEIFRTIGSFYKILQDNLRNRWANAPIPVPSWIPAVQVCWQNNSELYSLKRQPALVFLYNRALSQNKPTPINNWYQLFITKQENLFRIWMNTGHFNWTKCSKKNKNQHIISESARLCNLTVVELVHHLLDSNN